MRRKTIGRVPASAVHGEGGRIMITPAFTRPTWLLATTALVALIVVLGAPAQAQLPPAQSPGVAKSAGAASAQQTSGTASPARPVSGANSAPSSPPTNTQPAIGGSLGGATTNEKQTPTPGNGLKSKSEWVPRTTHEFELLLVYVGLLFALMLVLHLTDTFQAYGFSRETRDKLLEKLQSNASADDVSRLTHELGGLGTPTGIPGTTRSIFTYAFSMTLGIAIFHLLAFSRDPEAGKYADKLLTVLAGAVSSIIGFYFGSKATKEGAESKPQPGPEPPKPLGTITSVTPKQAKAGEQVMIEGTGFGDREGTVKFGPISADKADDWKVNSIKVKVPQHASQGPTAITVNPVHDSEIAGSPALFEVVV